MAAILKALKLTAQPAGGGHGYDVNVYKSIRNLANVSVVPVAELNALNVLTPQRLLMTTRRWTPSARKHRRNSKHRGPPVAAL